MKAAEQFGWSKTELIANIAMKAHENIVLDIEEEKKLSDHHGMVFKCKNVLFTALICFQDNLLTKYWNIREKWYRRRRLFQSYRFKETMR